MCKYSDRGLSKLSPLSKRNPNIRRAGIRYGDVEITSPAWFRLFLQQRRVRLAANVNNEQTRQPDSSGLAKLLSFICSLCYIKLAIFYHSTDAASGHPLASNATQPHSTLLSEVDSGRGAGWEMRRCKRKRRRILSVALILRDVSRNRRAFRRVRDT